MCARMDKNSYNYLLVFFVCLFTVSLCLLFVHLFVLFVCLLFVCLLLFFICKGKHAAWNQDRQL